MQRTELRLELLNLTYSHGRDPAEAVGRAKILEQYLFEEEQEGVQIFPEPPAPPQQKAVKGRPRKNVGNVDFLE